MLDYGAKASIVRLLEHAGATVTVLPHDATAAQVDAFHAAGLAAGHALRRHFAGRHGFQCSQSSPP